MKKYIEGIKFGMIVQFIIGPICLLVFNTSKNNGFFYTLPLIIVIACVDTFYITLSCIGASKIFSKKKVKNLFKIIGSIILILFGTNTILNGFKINILPGMNLKPSTENIMIEGLLLALSNPIVIMFCGSVLTTKLIEEPMKKRNLIKFCMGLVSSTLIFLTTLAFISSFIAKFMPEFLSNIINIIVGLIIIYYGIIKLIEKPKRKKGKRHVKKIKKIN